MLLLYSYFSIIFQSRKPLLCSVNSLDNFLFAIPATLILHFALNFLLIRLSPIKSGKDLKKSVVDEYLKEIHIM